MHKVLLIVLLSLSVTVFASKLGIAWDGNGNIANWDQSSGGKIAWYYTWSPDKLSGPTEEFIPMLWGTKQEADFVSKHNAGGFAGASAILGFNEPDNSGQANLSPSTAVSLWNQYLQPLGSSYRLGAPAVTSGPSGIPWLQNFISECTGCKIDFIPIHWYGNDPNAFEEYVTQIHTLFNKPIWVTEFACVEYTGAACTQEYVYDFMGQTTLWLDQQSYVERYSWFGCYSSGIPTTDALLTSDGTARTGLGGQYIIVGGHS